MPTQFCSKNKAGEVIWVVDIPSDVIHLSELFKILEEMDSSADSAPVEIPFECTKEEILDSFERLRRGIDLFKEIEKFDHSTTKADPETFETMKESIAIKYDRWISMASVPKTYLILDFFEPIVGMRRMINAIEQYEDGSSPSGYFKDQDLTSTTINEEFVKACRKNKLGVMKWMYHHLSDLDPHYEMEMAFCDAVSYNYREIAEWMCDEIGGIDYRAFEYLVDDVLIHPTLIDWVWDLCTRMESRKR